jgi:hypothetical protein
MTQVVPLWSFGKYKSPTSKGWSYPDGNWYKNVRYDVFLCLSLLKTSPVNFCFDSSPNLCKTTYGNIDLRSSSIYKNISGCLPFTEMTPVLWQMEDDRNILENGRPPQHLGKWKTTSTFLSIEDDLNLF